jgi:transposase
MGDPGNITCEELLQRTNELYKAALHENHVKQLTIDALNDQLAARDNHISSLASISDRQHGDRQEKEDLIADQQTTIDLQQQIIEDKDRQIALQQKLINSLKSAAQRDQSKIAKLTKDNATTEGLRHGLKKQKKHRFGRRSEKTHGKHIVPGSLLGKGVSEADKARIKEIFDQSGYAVLEKKDRRVESLIAQGVPVEDVMLDVPESERPTGAICIGKNIDKKIVYVKARIYIRRYIQHVYIVPDEAKGDTYYKNISAPWPAELLKNRCKADLSLLIQLPIDKYVYGIPTQRQGHRYAQLGARMPDSSLYDWTRKSIRTLVPLYEIALHDMVADGMIHMDETGLLVIDKSKDIGKKSHRGWLLAMLNPAQNFACFKYAKGRGHEDVDPILDNFKGILHTDALPTYTKYGRSDDVEHGLCFTHARRGMIEAKDNDLVRSMFALENYINPIYVIERTGKREKLSVDELTALRQQFIVPILNDFHKWLLEEKQKVIPRSAIAEAINYFLRNWAGLTLFASDGHLAIDNNVLERQIRTVAMTRKNFMFAGSHDAAQNAAIMYTFIASCKLQNIDPEIWLRDVFIRIPTHPPDKLSELLPHNWKPAQSDIA